MAESAACNGGRPSLVHEYRRRTLAAMATLAGHDVLIDVLPDGARPDVVQVRPADRSLFIGDAKATETPHGFDTIARLTRYAAFFERYLLAGGSGVMALAVPPVDRYAWLRLLRDVCSGLSVPRVEGRADLIDGDCAVLWEAFGPRGAAPTKRRVEPRGLDEVVRFAYSARHVRATATSPSGD